MADSTAPPPITPGGYDYTQFIPTSPSSSPARTTHDGESLREEHSSQLSSQGSADRTIPNGSDDTSVRREPVRSSAIPIATSDRVPVAVDGRHEPVPATDERTHTAPMFPLQGDGSAKLDKPVPSLPAPSPALPPPPTHAKDVQGDPDAGTFGTVASKDDPSANYDEHKEKLKKKGIPIPGTTDTSYNPPIDLVLVFSLPEKEAASEEWTAAEREYGNLKQILQKAGFRTTARAGAKGKNERLLLIRAVESVARAEAQEEKLGDWLYSIRGTSSQNNPNELRDFRRHPFSPAERTRLVNRVLQRTLHSSQYYRPERPVRLKAIFPPHDPIFNRRWLTNWSPEKIKIESSQLTNIKDQFGDGVALYFEFLRFYFRALGIPAFIGITTWLGGYYYSRLYSALLVLWSVVFIEGWKLREKQIAVQWGSYGASKHGNMRLGYVPESQVESVVTGEKIPYTPWWRIESKMLASVPVALSFAALLGLMISLIFGVEVIINEVYHGPGQSLLSLLPTIAFAGAVPQVVGLWQHVAKELTDWENHPTETGHQRSQILKMFALNGMVSYGSLTLTAYVYLPFGHVVIPYLVGKARGVSSTAAEALDGPVGFHASSERLTNTLFALMTTTQAIGAFIEVGLPYLQRRFAEYRNEAPPHKDDQKVGASKAREGERSEKEWLERIREETTLPEYSLFNDFSEMAVQFGHVVLWSTAWPLAPLAAFINNFVELRGDAFKLCMNSRRPIPTRTDTVGPWLEVLGFVSYIGALTNASLVYLLKPHAPQLASTKALSVDVAQDPGNYTLASTGVFSRNADTATARIQTTEDIPEVWKLLLGALLCALASEQGYRLVRAVVAHLLDELLWKGSHEEVHLRQTEWEIKKDYAESKGSREFEAEIERLRSRSQKDLESDAQKEGSHSDFWNEEDRGTREEIDRKTQ